MQVTEAEVIGKNNSEVHEMDCYKTADIYLASFIIARGYTMISADKITDKSKVKTFFTLNISIQQCNKLKTQFYSGQQLNVNVSRYTAALKNLKSACFAN